MQSSSDLHQSGGLCSVFVTALPVDYAAISTLGDPFEIETVCSTDPLAMRLDELQLDYGEGPCWQAHATGIAILVPDLGAPLTPSWPMLHAALAAHAIRGAYAFPMSVGSLNIGAVDLYAVAAHSMSSADVSTATALVEKAAIHVLRHAMAQRNYPLSDDPSSRRFVHQATGMVIAQLRVSAADALLVIRAHAFAAGSTVREVAVEIIERRLDFSA